MRTRILPAVLVLFLLPSARAWAGEVYSFTLEHHQGVRDSTRTGRVWVDGEHGSRYRLELDPQTSPRPFDVLIAKGAGAEEAGLGLGDRTYYTLKTRDPSLPTTRALWFFARKEDGKVGEVDAALAKARSRLRGFPVQTRVTVDIDMGKGSERQTYVYSLTVHDLKPAETPDSLFQVPDGFRYEEPVVVAPGMSSSGG